MSVLARLRRAPRRLLAAALVGLAGIGLALRLGAPDAAALDNAYADPLPPPAGPLRVFHLGHSLVGRDMPAMLTQLAEAAGKSGHAYESQLGWGTPLKSHWEPKIEINGFETENAHPRFRAARAALESGDYGAVILTEMVELRDAIRYHDSAAYLARWADLARQARPDARVYLYETWHRLDDADGWLARLDADLPALWEAKLLAGAAARGAGPIHVIPAGQVMAAFVRAAEAGEGGPSVQGREDLFARDADGEVDQIHLNDLGAYLVALTHYAVLYHASPEGLPHALRRADGSLAAAPDPETARLMQRIAWQVVTGYPKTGVAQAEE